MLHSRILILAAIALIALVATLVAPAANAHPLDEQIHARPIRPEPFSDAESLKKYLNQLKSFYQMNGQRYGKRFSSLEQPEATRRLEMPKRRSHKWPAVYEYIVKSWDET